MHNGDRREGLTPEAVIFRYLEAANRQPLSVEAFVRILSADADLLGRWLNLTALSGRTGSGSTDAITETCYGGHPQSGPGPGLGGAAGGGQRPARHGPMAIGAAFRFSGGGSRRTAGSEGAGDGALAGSVGHLRYLSLPQDTNAQRSSAHFGAPDRNFSVDAAPLIRIFSVVDAFEVVDEFQAAQLAQSLLGLAAAATSPNWWSGQGSRCADLVRSVSTSALNSDADWSNRLWVQQQVFMLTELLQFADNHEALQVAHAHSLRAVCFVRYRCCCWSRRRANTPRSANRMWLFTPTRAAAA